MNRIQKYSVLSEETWTGRVDDTKNPDSFRGHQCIQLIDLNKTRKEDIPQDGFGFCFLGFICDKGVEKYK